MMADRKLRFENAETLLDDLDECADLVISAFLQTLVQQGCDPESPESPGKAGRTCEAALPLDKSTNHSL
jgi:hypothetical protein